MGCCDDKTTAAAAAAPCGDCKRTALLKVGALLFLGWALLAEKWDLLVLAGVIFVMTRPASRGRARLSLVPLDGNAPGIGGSNFPPGAQVPTVFGTGSAPGTGGAAAPSLTVESVQSTIPECS